MLNVVSTLLRKKTSLRRYTLFLSLMVFLLSLFNLEMINCCCGSVAQSCPISVAPWTATCRASLSFIISWPWLKFTSIESLMLSNHFTLCFLLPSIFQASGWRAKELALHIRWWNYWSFSFSISPSSEYSGLIFFRTDVLAVQGTLMSLLQHHNSKEWVLWCSAFFMVQLSQQYMITGKTIALTIRTFARKVMFLLFNTSGLSWIFFQDASIF